MITPTQLQGCFPAVITPMTRFGREERIDFDAYRSLISRFIDAGCAGVVIAGTTGQSASLEHGELVELAETGAKHAREHARKKRKNFHVIVAAGSNSTRKAVDLSIDVIKAAHPDALLHATGYYNNPPQEGLLRHFQAVADAAGALDTPVILYNVPSRTKSNLDAATTIELARHESIIGTKEASGDLAQVRRILDETDRAHFSVVSGEDHLVADIMAMGGTGVISASANRWPAEFQRLTELAAAGRHEDAALLQAALMPCVKAVFAAKNPIPLHHMFRTALRLPLVALSELKPETRLPAIAAIEEALEIRGFPFMESHSDATNSSLDFGGQLMETAGAVTGEAASL